MGHRQQRENANRPSDGHVARNNVLLREDEHRSGRGADGPYDEETSAPRNQDEITPCPGEDGRPGDRGAEERYPQKCGEVFPVVSLLFRVGQTALLCTHMWELEELKVNGGFCCWFAFKPPRDKRRPGPRSED